MILDEDEMLKDTTDTFGNFEISNVKVGEHDIYVSFITSSGKKFEYFSIFQVDEGGLDIGELRLDLLGHLKGNVRLDKSNNHDDIEVFIPGTSFSAKTDKDGNFIIFFVPQARWSVKFVKEGYNTVEINDIEIIHGQGTTLAGVILTLPGTGSGKIMITSNTIWKKEDSPIIVTSDIYVNHDVILTIEEGVEIRFVKIFDGHGPTNRADLIIHGMLVSEGSQDEPIIFTSNETKPEQGDWGTIVFGYNERATHISILKYCNISFSDKGIWFVYTAIDKEFLISNCLFENNNYGIFNNEGTAPGWSKPSFEYCSFLNNNIAMQIGSYTNPDRILHCDFMNNNYGVICQLPWSNAGNKLRIDQSNFDNIEYNFYAKSFLPFFNREHTINLNGNYWASDSLVQILEKIKIDDGLEEYIVLESFESEEIIH